MSATPHVYANRLDGIPMPDSIRRLPVHPELKLPIPWFVHEQDFRVVDARKLPVAHREKRCWVCGEPRYPKRLAFVTGPMCVITRTSAEPPSHPACAEFSVRACPFLTQPRMRRNEKNLPEEGFTTGNAIMRNPGVSAILLTNNYAVFRDDNNHPLFEMGVPHAVEWWCSGRAATRDEVEASMQSGLPILQEQAALDGERGVGALAWRIKMAERWLPDREPLEAAD